MGQAKADISPFSAASREFRQERARRTFEALVEEASRAFADHGYDAVQTPDIAAGAGVSVGTFYRYFDDKREVLLEVQRRWLSRAYDDVVARLTPERFAGVGRRAAIDECVRVLFDHAEDDASLQRVFFEMSLRDAEFARMRRLFEDEAGRRLSDIIRVVTDRVRVPDPEATAYVLQSAALDLALRRSGLHGPPAVSRKRTLATFAHLVEQALFPA